MIADYLKQLRSGEEIRKNLIALKAELKDNEARQEWGRLLRDEEWHTLFEQELLKSEDAKVRKNAALLAGASGDNSWVETLYTAYEKEEQLFVKSSYLSAMAELNYYPVLAKLKSRMEELNRLPVTPENRKHVEEERRQLSSMLVAANQPKAHRFCRPKKELTMILTTNRNHIHLIAEELKGMQQKQIPAGLLVRTDKLEEIDRLRTVREQLFAVEGMKTVPANPEEAAEIIAGGDHPLLTFLLSCHEGEAPFYFRIEVKNKMEPDKKAAYVKRLASQIEAVSGRTLINTPSFYELEIRFIENKEGNYNIVIRLFTRRDIRFEYRKNVVAASIHPANAALTAALAKPWLKENAQVLDPFCGVGTMLIERTRLVKAGTMYGVDSFGEAIKGARENTKAAKETVNYINRDFFDFRHEYLFDEIITDMPWSRQREQLPELEKLYQRFFRKIPELLKRDGVIILYTHNRDFVRRYMGGRIRLIREFEVSMKEETYVEILGMRE